MANCICPCFTCVIKHKARLDKDVFNWVVGVGSCACGD